MSFAIVTDTSANLPIEYAHENDITIIPFSFYIDGEENTSSEMKEYFKYIKNKAEKIGLAFNIFVQNFPYTLYFCL